MKLAKLWGFPRVAIFSIAGRPNHSKDKFQAFLVWRWHFCYLSLNCVASALFLIWRAQECFRPHFWNVFHLPFGMGVDFGLFYGSPGCMLANSDRLAGVRVDRIETTPSKMKHNRIISGWMGSLIMWGSRKKMEVRAKPGGGNCWQGGKRRHLKATPPSSSLRSYVSHQCPFDYD